MAHNIMSFEFPLSVPRDALRSLLAWPGRVSRAYARYCNAGREIEWLCSLEDSHLRACGLSRDEIAQRTFTRFGIDLD